jgi:NAD(P)-dependent dehydrogenase (short-subunit alcohol dehydrogenase family)
MLKGKVALVTGASKGIGRLTALALAQAGAKVGLLARSEAALGELQVGIQAQGGQALALPGSVFSLTALQQAVEALKRQYGGLDILINNAGIGIFKPVQELTPYEWNQVIATNLTGPYLATHVAVPALLQRGGGHIVNVGSLASKNAFAGGAAYNASKFGLLGFSEAIMQDLRQQGIRVSTVLPGSVNTHFGGDEAEADWKIQPQDVAEAILYVLQSDPRITPGQIELRPSRLKPAPARP